MKPWPLRIAVVLSALALLAFGAWMGWREWYSANQLRASIQAEDTPKVYGLLRWDARADEGDLLYLYAPASRR